MKSRTDTSGWRFANPKSVEKWSERFALRLHNPEDPWEFQLADPGRIDEFIAAYSDELSEDDRFALMQLIIASLDEYPGESLENVPAWDSARQWLIADAAIHADTIYFWANPGEKDPKELYRITPYMRDVLEEISDQ